MGKSNLHSMHCWAHFTFVRVVFEYWLRCSSNAAAELMLLLAMAEAMASDATIVVIYGVLFGQFVVYNCRFQLCKFSGFQDYTGASFVGTNFFGAILQVSWLPVQVFRVSLHSLVVEVIHIHLQKRGINNEWKWGHLVQNACSQCALQTH